METTDEIISKISEHTGMDKKEIQSRIKEKQNELSNLISEEGAAYIVAKEAGIELIKKRDFEIKAGNIIAGMKGFNASGRVIKTEEPREFKTKKAEGKLCSLLIGDETGMIRLVLWNDQTDKIKDIKRDNMVKITGAYAKDNMGRIELGMGRMGNLEKIQDSPEIPYADEIEKKFTVSSNQTRNYVPKKISELREGDNARIRACIVHLFETKPFFFTCPECGMKVQGACEVHGKKEPNIIVSGIVDDSTGNMRAVFFRSAAEKIIGMGTDEAWKLFEASGKADDIMEKISLGKDLIFKGFVKKNKLFERLEFVVNEVEEVDVRQETERLLNQS